MNVKYNDHTRMLEVEFSFRDVKTPNLFRNIYPYKQIPKIVFNHRMVPMDIPERIFITDTTFRDGQQSRSPYTVDQIVRLFDLLGQLDNGSGTILHSEFFIYSNKDKEAIEKCNELDRGYPKITAWIRAKKEDFVYQAVRQVKEDLEAIEALMFDDSPL